LRRKINFSKEKVHLGLLKLNYASLCLQGFAVRKELFFFLSHDLFFFFFLLTSTQEVIQARRTESLDAPEILKLVSATTEKLFGRVNVVNIM